MYNLLKVRLCFLMFIQFFIWGAWYPAGGNYMRSAGMSDVIYLAYMSSPVGSIVSPFLLGMIADRFFAIQKVKVMGVVHLSSGIFIFLAPLMTADGYGSDPVFLLFVLLHMLCYMPTVGLATATSFHL